MLVSLRACTPSWRLHTGLCKFVQNHSLNKYLNIGKTYRPKPWRSFLIIYLLQHYNFLSLFTEWFSKYFLDCLTVQRRNKREIDIVAAKFIMVIAQSGVQFWLKSYAWFQNRTSAQREFDLLSHAGQNYWVLIGWDRGHFFLIKRALLVIKRAWLLDADWLSTPALNWFPASNGFWKGTSETHRFWVWS